MSIITSVQEIGYFNVCDYDDETIIFSNQLQVCLLNSSKDDSRKLAGEVNYKNFVCFDSFDGHK